MRARRFQAATIAEAYEEIRTALGDDAVIISTRQAVAPGMFGFGKREFVEVVAGVPDETDGATPLRPLVQDAAAHDLVRGLAERAAARDGLDVALPQELPAYAARRPETPTPVAELAPPFVNSMAGSRRDGPFDVHDRTAALVEGVAVLAGDAPVTSTASAKPAPRRRTKAQAATAPSTDLSTNDETLASLAAGLQDIRALVERLTLNRANDAVDSGPAALVELRSQLIDQGVAPVVLLPILDHVASSLVADATMEATRQAVQRRLAAALPPPVSLEMAKRPAVVFVIGPAGAGKTTAAVRLGLQLLQQGLRVTIAGTDVDRAGAPQQLQAYGTAAGLNVRICYTPGELQALIAEGSADLVIVDTPGHNGTRADKMAELHAFTQAARERSVLLVLPATMQRDDLLHTTRAYAPVQPRALVLTRCDETETFGGLLTAVEQSGIGVAYTMHGDALNEPARPGDNHTLAASVLTGRWPERADVVSRGRRAG